MTEHQRPSQRALLEQAYLRLEELESRLALAQTREPIAIVGAACRLPGGIRNLGDYWDALASGKNAIVEIPPNRWDVDAFYDADPEAPGKMYTRWGGFLEGVELFDAAFFGIAPREVEIMDPLQRLLLEASWEALENAGIATDSLVGSPTGVFFGAGFSDYARLLAHLDITQLTGHAGSGVQSCFCTGRVSYLLGARGPSMPIDTACSSSLVALHYACQSLRSKECDMALTGGVNLLLSPEGNVFLSKAGALSPTGTCKTFDASADGFVRSEGCGVLVLKRLRDAMSDGSRVMAVVRGSAVNHDGRTAGLSVPSGPAQEAVMRAALKDADVDAEEVSYLESHGTGTKLGDPIEVRSTCAVYGKRAPDNVLSIGSVKTNLGHTEAASGVTSVIKVALMLSKRRIAPHIHFRTWNPLIELGGAPIRVPTEETPWRVSSGSRFLAGVSAFGLSGTNAHVILEAAPENVRKLASSRRNHVLTLSARRQDALRALAGQYRDKLQVLDEDDWPDACATAAAGRAHYECRLAISAESLAGATERLGDFLAERQHRDIHQGRRPASGPPRLAFVFSGQFVQYPKMGAELIASEPAFRRALHECEALWKPLAGWSLIEEMLKDPSSSRLEDTTVSQPALFAFQIALARLWHSWGLEPDAVVGHSLGEVAAAHVAGCLTLKDALRIVHARSQALGDLAGRGAMVAIRVTPDEAGAMVRASQGHVALAAINGPKSVVLSGDPDALSDLLAARQREFAHRYVSREYAFHSHQTVVAADSMRHCVGDIRPQSGHVSFYSTVDCGILEGPELDLDYWCRNITETVRLAPTIAALANDGFETFLEIGPRPALTADIDQCVSGRGESARVIASMAPGDPLRTLQASLAQLYCIGSDLAWSGVYPRPFAVTDLPSYPWQGRRHWLPASPAGTPARSVEAGGPGEEGAFSGCLYSVRWEEATSDIPEYLSPGSWLILGDPSGLGQRLGQALEAFGHETAVLATGASHQGRGDDPAFMAMVSARLDELLGQDKEQPVYIVHLSGLCMTRESWVTGSLLSRERSMIAGAVAVMQALSSREHRSRARLWLVTRGAQAVGSPHPIEIGQAPLWGLGRTYSTEQPETWGGLIDLDPNRSLEEACESLARLLMLDRGEDQAAIRGSQQFVARVTPESLGQAAQPLRIRADGAYLIAGGLKGLGYEVARWLVREGARHLVILGRTPLESGEKDGAPGLIDHVRELQGSGAEVCYLAADVSNEEQLSRSLESYRSRGQNLPIVGVVHAASVWQDVTGRGLVGPIATMEHRAIDYVMAPKVLGTWLLRQAVRDEPLDFFLMFSAGATIVGSVGQGVYAAANAFLDACAHDMKASGEGRALAINWGPIADVGFGATQEGKTLFDLWERRGIQSLSPSELLEAIAALIPSRYSQIGVMRMDWGLLRRSYAHMLRRPWASLLFEQTAEEEARDLVGELAGMLPEERMTFLAEHVMAELRIVMGFSDEEPLDVDQGLFELGMDSLLAVELKNRLQSTMRREFPVAAVFEHSNIADLTSYLIRDVLQLEMEEDADSLPEMPEDPLDRIAALSEDEVRRMLSARTSKEDA